MSAAARKRAKHLQQDPDVQKWVKDFQRLCARMPPGLMVYVGGSNNILALDEQGHQFMDGDRVDPDAHIDDFDGRFEGGDY